MPLVHEIDPPGAYRGAGARLLGREIVGKGAASNVTVSELQERAVVAGLFSLDDGTARRALDGTVITPVR